MVEKEIRGTERRRSKERERENRDPDLKVLPLYESSVQKKRGVDLGFKISTTGRARELTGTLKKKKKSLNACRPTTRVWCVGQLTSTSLCYCY